MRKIFSFFYVFAVLSAIISCNNPTPTKVDENEGADNDSIDINDTILHDIAYNGERIDTINIKFKEYRKRLLFESDTIKYEHHENYVFIEWPDSIDGFDVKNIQAVLRDELEMGDRSVESFVNYWLRNTFGDCFAPPYTIVKKFSINPDTLNERESMDYFCGGTKSTLVVKCAGIDRARKFITYYIAIELRDGPMNMHIHGSTKYITYDYANNKVVKFDDLIKSRKLASKELMKQFLGVHIEDYNLHSYEKVESKGYLLEGVTEKDLVTDVFHVKKDTFVMVFPKYSISYGGTGAPEVGFDVTKNPSILTEYGKKLLLGK